MTNASHDSGLWTAPISRADLSAVMRTLCADSEAVFGIQPAQTEVIVKAFADLWSKAQRDIVQRLTALVRHDEGRADLAGAELQPLLLRAAGVEMAKLAMHLRPLKGKVEIVNVAALLLYVMESFGPLHLIGPAAKELSQEERLQLAQTIRSELNGPEWQRAIAAKTLPGLSASQNTAVINYAVKRGGPFSGKVMIAFAAACILVMLFAV